MRIFSFFNFSAIFLGIFFNGRMNGIPEKKFFSLFFGLSHPVLAKNNAGKRFFNFLNFFAFFFWNFIARVECERNSGLKFFSHFLGQSYPALAKNNVGKRFLNFFNIFDIFFEIFLPESSLNGIRK